MKKKPQTAVSWMAHHRYRALEPAYTKIGHRRKKLYEFGLNYLVKEDFLK